MRTGPSRRHLLFVASLWLLAAAQAALGKRVWNRFALQGKTFNQSSAYATEVVPDVCTCRRRCFVQRKCKAWTTLTNRKRQIECSYREYGPIQTSFLDLPNALYGFMEGGSTVRLMVTGF
ncbi:uncharacterized protein LOC119592900 [Penaeus monodon]|uniref:uncharacterized protein LOC119592900 n=1 Tax=Penaeus monodon TaxID=6687 RepID=UPI0018A794C3|nr:uncharacterized protein LOC119592900 [Penaeus monodon]